MRTFAKSQIRYSKSQRMGIFAFVVVLVGLQIAGYFLNRQPIDSSEIKVPDEVLLLDAELEKSFDNNASKTLKEFDPNELSEEEWRNLGFSAKQVSTIFKYKYSLGGYFSTKEEIRQCFVISEKKFAEIEPYIKISPIPASKKNEFYTNFSKQPKAKIHYQKFNPNDYGIKDWQKIGFTKKQAESILKYKKMLGGKFTNLEQIRKCYMIDEEKFREMKPFIVLPKPKSSGTIELLEEKDSSSVSTIQILE